MLWTSAATGKEPFAHRVASDYEPDGNGSYRPVGTQSRAELAVWNRVSAAGGRCVVVGWPNTDHLDPVEGWFVSERWSLASAGSEHSAIFPKDRQAAIDDLLIQPNEIGQQFIDAIVSDVDEVGLLNDQLRSDICRAIAATSSIHNVATLAAERSDWNLLAVAYPLVGGTLRRVLGCFTAHTDSMTDAQKQAARAIGGRCWQLLDQMLGRLLELVPKDTRVLLFSTGGLYDGDLSAIHPLARDSSDPHQIYRWNTRRRNRERGIFVWAGSERFADQLVDEVPLVSLAPMISKYFGLPDQNEQGFKKSDHSTDRVDTEAVWHRQRFLDDLQSLGFIEPLKESFVLEDLCRIRMDNLVESAMYSGRLKEASDLLQQILEDYQRPECIALLAECQLGMKQFDLALSTIERLEEFKQSQTTMLSLMAKRFCLIGDNTSAEQCLSQLIQREDRDRIALAMGRISMSIQCYPLAIRFLEIAAQRLSDDGRARLELGNALLAVGRFDQAVKQHKMAVRLLPGLGASHQALARSLLANGDPEASARAAATATRFATSGQETIDLMTQVDRHSREQS